MAVARGVRRPGRRDGLAPVRAGAGRLRRRSSARPPTSRPRRRTARGAAAAGTGTSRTPRSPISASPLPRTSPPPAPPAEGAIRFLEGGGTRATLELVADEVLQLLRAAARRPRRSCRLPVARPGADAARGGVRRARRAVCARRHRAGSRRRPSATRCSRCSATPGSGRAGAICSAFVRSPYSGLGRAHADFLEGRLRGRGIRSPSGSRRDRQAARRAARRRSSGCARRRRRSRPCASSSARC